MRGSVFERAADVDILLGLHLGLGQIVRVYVLKLVLLFLLFKMRFVGDESVG